LPHHRNSTRLPRLFRRLLAELLDLHLYQIMSFALLEMPSRSRPHRPRLPQKSPSAALPRAPIFRSMPADSPIVPCDFLQRDPLLQPLSSCLPIQNPSKQSLTASMRSSLASASARASVWACANECFLRPPEPPRWHNQTRRLRLDLYLSFLKLQSMTLSQCLHVWSRICDLKRSTATAELLLFVCHPTPDCCPSVRL